MSPAALVVMLILIFMVFVGAAMVIQSYNNSKRANVKLPKNFGHVPGVMLLNLNSDGTVEIILRNSRRRHGNIEELGRHGRAYYDENHYLTKLSFDSSESMEAFLKEGGGFQEFPTLLLGELRDNQEVLPIGGKS